MLFDEVIPAIATAFGDVAWLFGLILLGAIGAVVVERRIGVPRVATRGLALLAICGGLYLAWQRLWLCDDAFITFHYARNLADGNGLVFNPGEWVEGYTNFLWTAVLGGVGAVGIDIPMAGLFGNLAAFVLAVWLTGRVVRAHGPDTPPGIPWAMIALCGSLGFTTFASSGLETMPAAALVVAGVLVTGKRPLIGGLLFVLAAMTRPDHLLLWGCMGLAMASEDVLAGSGNLFRRLNWKRYIAFTLPLVLVFVPYFLIRWKVYGDPFPNTYYAKSGGEAYYRQGWIYFVVWAGRSGAWLFLPLLFLGVIGRVGNRHELRLRIFGVLAVLIFGHYIVRVGGDFMADRFFIVLWPIALATLEVRGRWIAARGHALLAGGLVALGVAAAVTPVSLFGHKSKRWHIAPEHTFYLVKSLDPLVIDSRYFRWGQKLGEVFADIDYKPRLAIGCVGYVGYYSNLPLVDRYGLTNRNIARKEIKKRGRPGHEKMGSRSEVMAEGAVIAQSPLWGRRWEKLTRFSVNGVKLHVLSLTPELRALFDADKRVRPPLLHGRIKRLARLDERREVLEELNFLQRLAPDLSTDDPAIAARLGSILEFEASGLPKGMTHTGAAPRILRRKRPPAGVSGEGWLETGPGRSQVRIPLDLSATSELRFALGGPKGEHRVELWAGDAKLHTAIPDGTGRLRPVSWPVQGVGAAQLRLIDGMERARSGLRIDGLHRPAAKNDVRQRLARPPATLFSLAELLGDAEAELPPTDPAVAPLYARIAQRFDFEDQRWPEGAEAEGRAFGRGPVESAIGKQTQVYGVQGLGFVNSFHGGDRATGVVRLPPFTVPPKSIVARVGGGRDCTQVSLGLEVDGKIVKRVCGRNDETLRPVLIATSRWAGKQGRIVIEDKGTGSWGHILVDDIIIPRDPAPAVSPPSSPPPN